MPYQYIESTVDRVTLAAGETLATFGENSKFIYILLYLYISDKLHIFYKTLMLLKDIFDKKGMVQ